MEKELLLSKKVAEDDIILEYFLISEIKKEDSCAAIVYGAGISLIKDNAVQSSAEVNDISCDKSSVESFVFMIAENEVTPSTLFDVVSDKIEEGYFESSPFKAMQSA